MISNLDGSRVVTEAREPLDSLKCIIVGGADDEERTLGNRVKIGFALAKRAIQVRLSLSGSQLVRISGQARNFCSGGDAGLKKIKCRG